MSIDEGVILIFKPCSVGQLVGVLPIAVSVFELSQVEKFFGGAFKIRCRFRYLCPHLFKLFLSRQYLQKLKMCLDASRPQLQVCTNFLLHSGDVTQPNRERDTSPPIEGNVENLIGNFIEYAVQCCSPVGICCRRNEFSKSRGVARCRNSTLQQIHNIIETTSAAERLHDKKASRVVAIRSQSVCGLVKMATGIDLTLGGADLKHGQSRERIVGEN